MNEMISIEVLAGGEGFFNCPSGICRRRDNDTFYIADMHNHRICWLHEDGNKGALPNEIRGAGGPLALERPLAVWVTEHGALYAADAGHNHIYSKLDSEDFWRPVKLCENSNAEHEEPPIRFTGGVTVDTRGNVYTNDFLNNRLRRIDPEGNLTTLPTGAAGLDKPYGLYYRDGRLYYTDTGHNRVCYLDLERGQVHIINPEVVDKGFSAPIAITLDTEGNIYVCEQRSMFFIDVKKNQVSLIMDRERWKGFMDQYSLKEKICHIGAAVVKERGQIYWVDTIKGYVYRMLVNL